MAEFTGKLNNIAIEYGSGKPYINIQVDEDIRTLFESCSELMKQDKLSIKITKHRAKRSLDANAFCWVLIGKIAEKTNAPREEVYRNAIREIGGNYDVVCAQDKAVEALRESWQKNGIGWVSDTMPSKIEGCTNVMLYYGSSTYDTHQMSRLLNLLCQDCDQFGIPTRPQEEIDSLLNSWRG